MGIIQRDTDGNEATQYGIDQESLVRKKYERMTGNTVEEVGLSWHPDPSKSYLGATPDGLVRSDSNTKDRVVLEIKCPHFNGEWKDIPVEYMTQIQMQMEIFDTPFCDFTCYFKKSGLVRIWVRLIVFVVRRSEWIEGFECRFRE